MRFLSALAVVVLLASGCASPCENINAAQTDLAMQTCVHSDVLNPDGTGSFSPEDGAPVAFSITERAPLAEVFPDGSSLSANGWMPAGETPPATPDSSRQVYTSAIAPEADRFALGLRWDRTVRIRSADGQPLATVRVADGEDEKAARMGIKGWPNRAMHLAFSPDGATLYGADAQNHVAAWDAASGATRWEATAALDHGGKDGRAITPDGIRTLALSPDGSLIAAASARSAQVWDAASGETVAQWAFPKGKTSVIGLEFSPDGRHVAVKKSGRYIPPTVRYSSFDERGQRVSTPEMQQTEAVQNPPTVFLMAIP